MSERNGCQDGYRWMLDVLARPDATAAMNPLTGACYTPVQLRFMSAVSASSLTGSERALAMAMASCVLDESGTIHVDDDEAWADTMTAFLGAALEER